MSETYDKAFSIVVGMEGGWVNNPADPGGETNWGITWVTLRTAISKGLVDATTTVKTLTQDQAKIIYKALYWDAVHGDVMTEPMCILVFDSAVNQGITPAIKMLQRALNVTQDGVFSTATAAAAMKATPWHCARFMSYRAMRYQSTRNFDKFGEGWLIRTYEVMFKAAK